MKILLFFVLLCTKVLSVDLQKPKIYKQNINDFSSWVMSEKYDGIRAYWNGKELLTKNGNKIFAPSWFTKNFPKFELDGELFTKRDDFENIQSIVLDKFPSNDWTNITYNIFEVPNQKGDLFLRLNVLKKYLANKNTTYLKIIPQIKIKNKLHLDNFLEKIISINGEGVIIKNYTKDYFTGRSNDVLKVKKFYDAEAKVVKHNYNQDGSFKSLKVNFNGKVFNLGGGFSDKQRLNPPKVGSMITFKYYNFTKNGIPKFASFLRVREKE